MVQFSPRRGKTFDSDTAFEKWMAAHHDTEPEIWIKIHKKASGLPSVTPAQALDVALCWGWIDGIRKGLDERSFLQRYSPRGRKSTWSQINREHVARLVAAGRMTPHGQRQVDAAKADGRWDAAYAPLRATSVENPARWPARRHRGEPAREAHARYAEQAQPLRACVPHQRHENPGGPREEGGGARRHAGPWADARPEQAHPYPAQGRPSFARRSRSRKTLRPAHATAPILTCPICRV